jgi:Flp pilus assembly protein TadD
LISLHANHHDLAVEWISRAIRQEPKPEYLTSLGTALLHQGRGEEALKTFDKAVQLRPDSAELWNNLGDVLLKLERPDEALLSFQHALTLDPHNSEAAARSASLASELSRLR